MWDFALNYGAVVASAVAVFMVGGLWYSPLLFSGIWAREAGWTKEATEAAKHKNMTGAYVAQFVLALVSIFVLAHFVGAFKIKEARGALQLAFWIWLGFQLPGMLGTILWERKTWKYVAINAGHALVSLVIAANILAYWK